MDFKDYKDVVHIIRDISFSLKKNHCLGIVGESGSGKSITCRAILGLLGKNFNVEGDAFFEGINLLKADKRRIRHVRGKEVSMILQNPMTSFDPLYSIENQMIETLVENLGISISEAKPLCLKAVEEMNIINPKAVLKKYPHELSGGMLQRVMIGIALTLKPQIIIADEPTTAVDSANQIKVLKEFANIKEKYHTSMIFISHDLGAIFKVADDIIVMKDGRIVEQGTAKEILNSPKNHHTKYLIDTRKSLVDRFNYIINK